MDKIAAALHPLERKVLPHISRVKSLKDLTRASGLQEVEVMRALQWLQNKSLIKLTSETKEHIELDENGKSYLKKGLPEKRFLAALEDKVLSLEEIRKSANLEAEELNVALGLLRGKAAIEFRDKKVALTNQGRSLVKKETLEEQFLNKLSNQHIGINELKDEERFAYDALKKRKRIIQAVQVKDVTAELTELGAKVFGVLPKTRTKNIESGGWIAEPLGPLTPEIIKSGKWKAAAFRRYDLKINVPQISGGRRHFAREAADYVKRIWIEMGFREMKGNIIQTSFWNFDALFTAQDHPVRELQDTFYIKDPAMGKLPDAKLVAKVREAHETGTKGSTGWQYKWNPENAKLNVMRTHTTCLSAKTIAALKQSDLPAKFFSVGKNFRNEALDWHHLFEFMQVEGIVIDENANLRHLVAYLREFFKKMGYLDVRIRPAYFPYTEPSCEVDVLHPIKKQWIELGGAGIFRPEMVIPLIGKDIPVLAWGLGLERTMMEYYQLTDIRDIYRNDLKQLREIKSFIK